MFKKILGFIGLLLTATVIHGAVGGPAGNFIRVQNTLQQGATFYVSSGTVTNLQTTTLKFDDGTTQTTAGGGGGGGSASIKVLEGTTTITASVSTMSFNINGFDLSTSTNGLAIALSSPSITRGLNAYFVGDSITFGAGASPSAVNNAYPARISNYFNWTKKILGIASSNVADYAYQVYPGFTHPDVASGYSNGANLITSTDTFIIWGDYNGLRDFGSVDTYKTHHENALKAVAAYAAIPQESKFTGQSSTVTRGGTWANASYYGGSMGTQSSTIGSSVTFSAKGKSVYVCMLNFSASTSPYSGGVSGRPDTVGSSFTITIDGVMISTYPNFYAYGNRAGYNGSDTYLPVGLNYAPWLYRIDNLKDSEHTVAVHVSSGHSNKPVTFLWGTGSGDVKYSAYTGPNVLLVNTIRPLLAGGSSLTTESAITNAINDFHNIQFKVSRELANDGLRVSYVDTNPFYDKTTAAADNVHPNNTGHQQIADAIAFGVSNLETSYKSGNLGGNSNYFPEGIKVSSSVFISQSNSVDIYKQNSTVNDYEKLALGWDGDVATIEAKTAGAGLAKVLRLKAGNNSEDAFTTLLLSRQSAPPFYAGVAGAAVAGAYPEHFKFIVEQGGLQGASATPVVIYSSAPITQSGTAGYDMLKLDAVEFTTGQGEKNLIKVARNGTTKAVIDSSGTYRAFNVSTSTTDFESLNIGYQSNIALIEAKSGGTGVGRRLELKAGNDVENSYTTLSLSRQSDPPFSLNTVGTSGYSNYFKFIVEPNGLQASSGNQSVLFSSSPILQTGTAGYDMLKLEAVENSTGSGERNLIRATKNSVDKFIVQSDGGVIVTSTMVVAKGSYSPSTTANVQFIVYPDKNYTLVKSTSPYALMDSSGLEGTTTAGLFTVAANTDTNPDKDVAVFFKETTVDEITGAEDIFRVKMSSVVSNAPFIVNTSLTIPNGTAPTLSASGNLAEDTTDNQLLYGSGPKVIPFHRQLNIPVANPSAGTYLIGKSIDGMNIRSINCLVDPAGTGENTVIQIQECDSNGDSCADVDSGTDITCGNTNTADDGTLSNPSVDAGDWYALEIVSVSGTVTQLNITIDYETVRE